MNRYYGQLMYCAFLPISIYAPSEEEALAELQRRTPEVLSEAERKEVLFHLTRISKADKVTVIKQEVSNAKTQNDTQSPRKASRALRSVRRGRFAPQPVQDSQGV
jgi:hypothetical protein